MADETGRSRLGRGLAALIGDVGDEEGAVERARGQRRVPIEFLRPNPRNPRRTFAESELEELAASIKLRGVIQPILVRAIPGVVDAYEIIAGERRWRASQKAGLHDVPVMLLEASDREALEIAIVENVQRVDLDPIEESRGYQRLVEEFAYSQHELARVVGKSRSHVANMLRLANLPESVQGLVSAGHLSAGHARALLSVADPDSVAQRAVAKGLSVRDLERIAQGEAASGQADAKKTARKDADTLQLEKALEDVLGLVVAIKHAGEGGEVRIRYKTLEQLDGLCRRLRG